MTAEEHWRTIDPTSVVCSAGGCREPARVDLDADGRPASDPWGWRCLLHPRPVFLVVVEVPAPGSPLNCALAGPIYLDPQAKGQPIDWEHGTPMQEIGAAIGSPAIGLWLRHDVFMLGEVLITNGERELTGAGRRPDKWGVRVERFADVDLAIERAREVTSLEHAEPFS